MNNVNKILDKMLNELFKQLIEKIIQIDIIKRINIFEINSYLYQFNNKK